MFACTQIQKQLDAFPLFRSSVTLNRIVLFIFALLLCARFSLPLTPASLPFPSLYLPSLPLLIRLPSSPPPPIAYQSKRSLSLAWTMQERLPSCTNSAYRLALHRTLLLLFLFLFLFLLSLCCPCVVFVLSLLFSLIRKLIPASPTILAACVVWTSSVLYAGASLLSEVVLTSPTIGSNVEEVRPPP